MESFDVIIIGGGPAGLNCALKLSKVGKKVLVLEKNNKIGPKVCAGGLTQKDIKYLKIPQKLLGRSFQEIVFCTPFIKTVITQEKPFLFTMDREKFGQWQLQKLKETDVAVRTGSCATKIFSDHLLVNNNEIFYFKNLVGADGSASIVRRFLGLKTKNIGIGVQYLIPTTPYHQIEFHYHSKLFGSWYAWIFPHKNFTSIGCGGNPRHIAAKNLRENFHKWLKRRNIDVSEAEFQAHPINSDYQGYQFDNIFLIGDAAGLASSFSGEGIFQALISGEEIAKIIINNNYHSLKMEELIATKIRHQKIVNILEKSGPFRQIEFEIIALSLKNKYIARKVLNIIT